MTIKKFIEELSKYPEDIELKDIPVRLAVEKEIGYTASNQSILEVIALWEDSLHLEATR